jgi:hypothetical protein
MADDRGVIREVAWRDIFPWLIIFRTFRLAKSMPLLFVATLGVVLAPAGWRVGEALFVSEAELQADFEFAAFVEHQCRWPGQQSGLAPPNHGRVPRSIRDIVFTSPNTLEPIYFRFVDPVARLLNSRLTVTQAAYCAFGSLWTLVVWGFFGGVITRIAVVNLGREEPLGLGAAVRHAASRLGAYVGSPLFPLVGVVLVALPICGLGLLARGDVGLLIAGILWVAALFGGMLIVILLLGLLFGWPLMWGAISAEERGDVFEAFSRSYSYTFQRPLHYLFYAALATFYGALAWLLVYHFSEGVIRFTEWAAAWGAGPQRWAEIVRLRDDPSLGGGMVMAAALLMGLGTGLVRTIAAGLVYSLFWCLAAAAYLLLRRDVDQTELDEVFADSQTRRYQLPAVDSPDTRAENAKGESVESPKAAESESTQAES